MNSAKRVPRHVFWRPLSWCILAAAVGSLVSAAPAMAQESPTVDAAGVITEAQLSFGLRVVKALVAATSGTSERSIVVSPYSLHAGLSLAQLGAEGATAEALGQLLGIGREMSAGYSELSRSILAARGESDVAIANSVWIDQHAGLQPPFASRANSSFGALVRLVDLSSRKSGEEINSWVAAGTRGLILRLLPDSLPPGGTAVLANALYVKSTWDRPFERSSTREGTFFADGGREVRVPFLSKETSMAYSEDGEVQTVGINLGQGRFSYVVVLPRERVGLKALSELVTAARVRGALESSRVLVRLKIPKGRFQSRPKLSAVLRELCPLPFGASADFQGMTKSRSAISDVLHEAVVDMNEDGIEAAAASAVVMVGAAPFGGDEPEPIEVIADRPYAFAVLDRESSAPLFLGLVSDPSGSLGDAQPN